MSTSKHPDARRILVNGEEISAIRFPPPMENRDHDTRRRLVISHRNYKLDSDRGELGTHLGQLGAHSRQKGGEIGAPCAELLRMLSKNSQSYLMYLIFLVYVPMM